MARYWGWTSCSPAPAQPPAPLLYEASLASEREGVWGAKPPRKLLEADRRLNWHEAQCDYRDRADFHAAGRAGERPVPGSPATANNAAACSDSNRDTHADPNAAGAAFGPGAEQDHQPGNPRSHP